LKGAAAEGVVCEKNGAALGVEVIRSTQIESYTLARQPASRAVFLCASMQHAINLHADRVGAEMDGHEDGAAESAAKINEGILRPEADTVKHAEELAVLGGSVVAAPIGVGKLAHIRCVAKSLHPQSGIPQRVDGVVKPALEV
jgi:hypothetical protein